MTAYEKLLERLPNEPKTWLVTGVAGFIGSNLLETLLKLDQTVIGLDNFSTGHQHNLDEVRELVTSEQWSRFRFVEGDICDLETCHQAVRGCDYVLHQAALGSVPRSIADPVATNRNNIDGFLNMLVASRDAQVKSFTYAASSSTYGDHPALPKVEDQIGNPLSPYALTKYVNELYAGVFSRCFGFHSIGLRYFNVFGPRQDPNGPYAAVIPKWLDAARNGIAIQINGDGETSRDFCFVDNAVQANLLAANFVTHSYETFNVAVGEATNLNCLFELLLSELHLQLDSNLKVEKKYAAFRPGDVRRSLADISRIEQTLGYKSLVDIRQGIAFAVRHFISERQK